jgi:hypothetical protein
LDYQKMPSAAGILRRLTAILKKERKREKRGFIDRIKQSQVLWGSTPLAL